MHNNCVKSISILLCVLSVIFTIQTSFAQTGPGGVGNADGNNGQPENVMWLDAQSLGLTNNTPVATWTDRSGNENNATQTTANRRPSFRTDYFDTNKSAIRFDNTSNADRLDIQNAANELTGSEYTVLIVGARRSNGPQRWIGGTNNDDNLNFVLGWESNDTYRYEHGGVGTTNNPGDPIRQLNTFSVFTHRFSLSTGSQNLTINGIFRASNSNSSLFSFGGAALARWKTNYYNVDLAEVIFYSNALNETQRIIVENYLNAKYNIPVAIDIYAGDTPDNGHHDYDVIGIGKLNVSDLHTLASASGLDLNMYVPSSFGNNSGLAAGHNNTVNSIVSSNVGSGVQQRWERTWYIDKTGTAIAEISFDFGDGIGGQYPQDKNGYVLLKWNSGTSTYDSVAVATTDKYVSDDRMVFRVSNALLTDGIYTLGTTDNMRSPLMGGPSKTWYSYANGDWNDPDTWTLDGAAFPLYENENSEIPNTNDHVVISSGKTVTIPTEQNNITILSLEVTGRLDLTTTSGHNFTTISGNGRIRMAGSGGFGNFPAGDVSGFVDPVNGGTVVIYGTGLTLNQARTFNHLEVNLDNTGNEAMLLANYTLNGNLTVKRGNLKINNNSTATSLTATISGDVLVEASGRITTGTANARHQLNLYGDLINNGTIAFTNRGTAGYSSEATNGIVDANFLSSTQNQEIQCNGSTRFYRIEIDKGTDATYILDISATSTANFQLFGPANEGHGTIPQLTANNNALGLLRGTVRINSNVQIPVLNNTDNYNISEAAQLWVNGGMVIKPTGTAIVPYGTARVSAGTFEANVNSGFTLRNNGVVLIEGGTLNANQIRTSTNGAGNVGSYIQSGGTANLLGGTTNTDHYVFNLTYPGNVFIMTGGVLNIEEANTNGGIFINSDPENINVTEGIVNMKINNANNFKITSRAPFYNVTMTNVSGGAAEFILDEGIDVASTNEDLAAQPLLVKNNFTIEANTTFDHNGNDVEIGRNFTVQAGADYVYDAGKPNTTTINGTANSLLAFYNRTGDTNDEQRFYNLVIDKPAGIVVSLASGKSDLTGTNNNLLRIDGHAFKLLSGTLDQGYYSIRVYSDTLVNYDVLGIYDPDNATIASMPNGNNDLIKFRPDDFALITADTSVFGSVRLNNDDEIVTLQSDVYIHYLQYQYGRINLQNHNLKIDHFDLDPNNNAEFQGAQKINNPSDMFIVDGNASDGGLSLYVGGNGTYTFPFGIGTGATDTNANGAKYTPAAVTVSNFSEDGYITINPVDEVLQTTNLSGGDLLSYYWRVRYEGFSNDSNLPTVEYRFFYDNSDIVGSENNYIGGKVLDVSPFTRSGEEFEDLNKNGTIDTGEGTARTNSVNETNKWIRFRYNGTDNTGFTLEQANYTAGEEGRFTGGVQVFYTRQIGGGASAGWRTTSYWTLATNPSYGPHDSRQSPAGDYPQAGDVAVIGWVPWEDTNVAAADRGRPHGIALDNTESFAELRFTQMLDASGNPTNRNYYRNFQFRPTVVINPSGVLACDKVRGEGLFWLRSVGGSKVDPDFSTIDIGDFITEDSSYLIYESTSNSFVYNNIPAAVPNMMIAGDGWGANDRDIQISTDVIVNEDFEILGDANLILSSGSAGNISVLGDLKIFRSNVGGNDSGGDGEISFPNSASRTIEVFGDLQLNNTGAKINIRTANTPANMSNLIVHGNILQNSTDTDADGLQLYPGSGLDYIQLQLKGEGNHTYTRTSGDTPALYNLIVNKGANTTSSFSFDDSFTLNAPTNGATKAIELQSGLLIFNDAAIDLSLTTGGSNFSIPAAAGLEVQEGTVRASGNDTGILLDGLLRISNNGNAFFNGAGNGNNYIQYSASGNASLEISGNGELTVGSQIRRGLNASTGVLRYSQTGGTVIAGANAAPETNRGVFEITNDAGSSFTHTGGDLFIARQNGTNPSIAALYLDPQTSNVSGSTITLGHSSSPASQTITINSGITLNNVVISNASASTPKPTVRMRVRPLNVGGTLTINSGTTLDANALGLNLSGNFVNNGTFTANGNTTSFNASGAQSLSGSSTTTLWNFIKNNSGTLTLGRPVVVGNDLTINQGTLADAGNTISVYRNLEHNATHTSNGGEGIKLLGTAQQQITRNGAGNSIFGILTISNLNGVIIPESQGYDFTITNTLRMAGGVFNIGSSLLSISENATIAEVSSFSNTNMIQTNSSFSDAGVQKLLAAGTTTDFIFPVGESRYTPATLKLSSPGYTSGSSAGNVTVIPAREVHSVINNSVEETSPTDMENVLQYYWTIDGNNLTGFNAEFILEYDQADVSTDDPLYDETDYIPARILSDNNPNGDINKFDASLVNESTNEITFLFNNVTDGGVSGDYFAGVDQAIPNVVPTYTTTGIDDGYTDQDSWNETIPVGGPVGSIIIVQAGHALTVPSDGINVYRTEIQSGAILDLNTTTKHRLGIVTGQGIIKVESNTLPAGFYENFFTCSGGGIEYAGVTDYDILGSITELRSLTVSGSGERRLPNSNIRICDNFTIDGPTLTNENNVDIEVDDDLIVQSGVFETGVSTALSVDRNLLINGGIYQGESGHTNTVGNHVTISAGSFVAGTNATLAIGRNLTFSGGTFSSGSGNALIRMQGSSAQIITGNFTQANSAVLNRLEINNSSGLTLAGNADIQAELLLTTGLVRPGTNKLKLTTGATVSPAIGKANSYVNGRLYKDIVSGGSFTFPVGKGNRWGYASVENVSSGTHEWNVEYFNASPATAPTVTNLDFSAPIETISGNEYWRVEDNAAGSVTANIGIMWDGRSDVSASSTDWYELMVLAWNGTNAWVNHGGTGHNANPAPTYNHGFFTSTTPISFSTKYITMGSTSANNPLPVELLSFSAKMEDRVALLQWVTASERNNDFFEVQRSINGQDWTTIGVVEGAGDSDLEHSYSFTDNTPLYGISYYRLRQVDFDAQYEYSKVIVLENVSDDMELPQPEVLLYPNPAQLEKLIIRALHLHAGQEVEVSLTDVYGKQYVYEVVKPEDLEKGVSIRQSMSLPSGLYLVSVKQRDIWIQKKLILKKD